MGGCYRDANQFLRRHIQDALNNLSKANLIKDSGEGIKILKKCF